jgi:hypothetical protein
MQTQMLCAPFSHKTEEGIISGDLRMRFAVLDLEQAIPLHRLI